MEAMIKAAAEAGVDIVKFQSFKAEKLRKDYPDYKANYAYYKAHELSDSDHYFIVERCQHYNIEPLFTVYDLETVSFLADDLGVGQVKIASPDMSNWELIDRCLEKFSRVFISTGMHSKTEISELRTHVYNRASQVVLLHCVSQYPTEPKDVNLSKLLGHQGFSDHTTTLDASKLAISLGADYVERHFTLSRHLPGRDHHISSTPEEFAELVAWRDMVKVMMGSGVRELSPGELASREKFAGRFYGN
ncbi:MAG: N-acetylneuraminate synthase family protein [Dehalococcoidia bacterium]